MHFLATFWPENGFFGLFWRFFLHFHKFWPFALSNHQFWDFKPVSDEFYSLSESKTEKIWKKKFFRGKPWIFEKLRIFCSFLIFNLKCFQMRVWIEHFSRTSESKVMVKSVCNPQILPTVHSEVEKWLELRATQENGRRMEFINEI